MVVQALLDLRQQVDMPIMVAWNGPAALMGELYALLEQAGIPRFRTPVRCARAFGALWQHASARNAAAALRDQPPRALQRPATRDALAGRTGDLVEYEAKRVLADYGITPTRETLAASADERGAGGRCDRLSGRC